MLTLGGLFTKQGCTQCLPGPRHRCELSRRVSHLFGLGSGVRSLSPNLNSNFSLQVISSPLKTLWFRLLSPEADPRSGLKVQVRSAGSSFRKTGCLICGLNHWDRHSCGDCVSGDEG